MPAASHLMNTYGRLPFALSHGRGCRVWDTNGSEYLDALAGIAVNTLGHEPPQAGAGAAGPGGQADPLLQLLPGAAAGATGRGSCASCRACRRCSSATPGWKPTRRAIKIARKFGHDRGIERPEIIVYEKAFHGRSIATLSATGNPKVQKGFEPLVEGFVRVPLNDIGAVREVARSNPNVVAVFLETIQGEGGINPTRWEYLQRAAQAVRRARTGC